MKLAGEQPLLRAACAAALALAAWAAGGAPEHFEWQRHGLAGGELWRLWSGHLVHGSLAHFGYDVGAAALLLLAFGPSLRLLWMAPAIGLALGLCLPGLEYYYGLSALLHAWVVAIAADLLRQERGARAWLAAALLLGTIAKAGFETWTQASVFTADLDFGGPVVHASHLVGALIGLCPWLRERAGLELRARVQRQRSPLRARAARRESPRPSLAAASDRSAAALAPRG